MPARLKSFFEKVFEPGFAFKYHQNDSMWDKLLKGKSAHVFVTMDAPYFFYWLFFGAPGHKMIKRGILKFCGIKPVTFSTFGPIISSTKEKRKTWLNEVAQIAKKIVAFSSIHRF
jgi:putative NADPH-quinone reductase